MNVHQSRLAFFFPLVVSLLSLRSYKVFGLTFSQDFMENPSQPLRWQPNETISLGNLNQNPALKLLNPLENLGQNVTQESQGFVRHLKRSLQMGFPEAINSYFRELGVHPAIQIKTTEESNEKYFRLNGQSPQIQGQSYDHRFLINSVPICDVHARSHKLSDGSGLLMGEIPRLQDLDLYLSTEEWPPLDLTQQSFEASMLLDTDDSTLDADTTASPKRWIRADKCYLIRNQKPLPVWNLTVRINGSLYSALADTAEVYQFQPQFFAVDGKATTWAHNRSNEPLTERPLYGLVGDGTLSSELIRTVVPPEIPKAQEPSHIFSYLPSDRRIEEVTAYANAQDHLRWFQSLGFTWYGVKPLEIRIHERLRNDPNTAEYGMGIESTNTPPTITIADGDGVNLQNLITDGDVVSHELGHHVIFKTLTATKGEAKILHEGLADFFVFFRTGDPCLGETICPAESGACQLKGKCLRSAANRLAFNDEVWKGFQEKQEHLKSQLISGMLWDLRSSNQFQDNALPSLVLKAVSYFAESSNICQYIRALYAADQELFGKRHWDLIQYVAKERGLGEFSDPTKECSEGSLKLPNQNLEVNPKKKSKSKSQCGTISSAFDPHKNSPSGPILLMMTLPAIILGLRSLMWPCRFAHARLRQLRDTLTTMKSP